MKPSAKLDDCFNENETSKIRYMSRSKNAPSYRKLSTSLIEGINNLEPSWLINTTLNKSSNIQTTSCPNNTDV